MSDKKPNTNNSKAASKNTSKKAASGKVIKPLRRTNAAKSGQAGGKSDPKATNSRKERLFGRLKKDDEQGAYTSVKNQKVKEGFWVKRLVPLLVAALSRIKTAFA